MIDSELFTDIYNLLKKNKMISGRKDMAKVLGENEQGVTDLKSGKKKVTEKHLIALEKGLPDFDLRRFLNNATRSSLDARRNLSLILDKDLVPPAQGIPYYDIYAAAGPVDMYSDLQEYITDYLHFPGIDAKEYDFAVKVWGPSMQGIFDDGDIALCKEVQDRSMINYGAPYFIITSEFKTIKYVHTSERDGYVKLRSENDQFDTFEIPMNSIYKIFHARTGVSIKVKRISS